jgi:uridine kinase
MVNFVNSRFDASGKPLPPYIIGIGGGSASGKTSVSEQIIKDLGVPWVALLSMDSFYNSLTPEQIEAAHQSNFNFDHPDAFSFDLLYKCLLDIKKGIKVEVPVYDFATHSRLDRTEPLYGANVVLFEGIFALYDKRVRDLMDLKLFVDTDADVRLSRRLRRDIAERGRNVQGVLTQYEKFVKPAFDDYIHPTMKFADVIIPRGLDNTAAIDVITKHIQRQLDERGVQLRPALQNQPDISPNVILLPQTPQLRHIHTIVRDASTPRPDFIFYVDHLSRVLAEEGLAQLPFEEKVVSTPTGSNFVGKVSNHKIVGISVVRGGASLEHGLRKAIKDLPIGKLLIETNESNEPVLQYYKFPPSLKESWALIVDDQIATGAAAMMAIRMVLDHHVPEDKIIFLSLMASPLGLKNITNAFPQVKIVTTSIDEYDGQSRFIPAGLGNFSDRYFGTNE